LVGGFCDWPFKFKVKHTRGVDNVVADVLSLVFEGQPGESPEMTCAALLEFLPLVYSSIEEHQTTDPLLENKGRTSWGRRLSNP